MVSYLDVIEHIEVLIDLFFLTCAFIKVTIYLYCAHVTLSQVFKVKKKNNWHIPLLIVVMYGLALFKGTNFIERTHTLQKLVPYFLDIPFQFIIPFLLGLIVFGKTLGMKRKNQRN